MIVGVGNIVFAQFDARDCGGHGFAYVFCFVIFRIAEKGNFDLHVQKKTGKRETCMLPLT